MNQMINEFCSKCNSLTDMTKTKSERTEKNSKGKDMKILTNSYHCASCHTFVRSEDIVVKYDK